MKQKTKNRINQLGKICFWLILYSNLIFLGFISGMIFQQILITEEVTRVLSYIDLEINLNFNETKFIEEFNKTIIPIIKQQRGIS